MPPLRHLVLFKLSSAATAERVTAMKNALMTLPTLIPNILYYQVVPHLSHPPASNQGYSLMIDSIFADIPALAHYAPHQAHQDVIKNYIMPIREDTLCVDYELPESFNIDAFQQLQHQPHVRHIRVMKPKTSSINAFNTAQSSLSQLEIKVPGILSVMHGAQPVTSLYPGYVDRSQGLLNVIEFVLKDKTALSTCLSHADYQRVTKDLETHLDNAVTFDYECGSK